MFFFFFMLKFLFFIMIELFYIVVFVQSIGVPNWNMQRCGKDCIVLSTPLSFFGSNASFSRSVWQISRKSFHTSDILMPFLQQDCCTSEVLLSDWPTPACVFLCRAAVMALCGGWTDAGDRATPLAAEGGAHRLAVGGIVASISPSAGI